MSLNYCPYCKKNTVHRKPCRQITKQSESIVKKQTTLQSSQQKTQAKDQDRLETDVANFAQNYPLLWKNISDRLKNLEQLVQDLEYRTNPTE